MGSGRDPPVQDNRAHKRRKYLEGNMNDLNSVILEGKATITNQTPDRVMIGIESKRNDNLFSYAIKMQGKLIPAAEKVEVGDKLRVVGYLTVSDGEVFIVADHFEVKGK
jgi:hypothetical protein